jgi:hypothetical protein
MRRAQELPPDGGTGLRAALLLCTVIPIVFCLTLIRVRRAAYRDSWTVPHSWPAGSNESGLTQ